MPVRHFEDYAVVLQGVRVGDREKTIGYLQVSCRMARTNYRQLRSRTIEVNGLTPAFKIVPLDSEQVPTGYLESVKLSIIGTTGEANQSYMIGAATDANEGNWDNDTITVGATGQGGGTVWLKLKRSIRDQNAQDDRNDGAVYVILDSQDGTVEVNAICEVWGRFIELQLV